MAFRSAASNKSTTTSVVVTKPTGVVDGDILIAHVASFRATNQSPGAITLAGFTWVTRSVGTYYASAIGWKRASSEGASYTFTSTNATQMEATVMAFSGRIGTGNPYSVALSNTAYATAGTPVRAATLTALAGDDLAWGGWFYLASGTYTLTKPTNFTLAGNSQVNTTNVETAAYRENVSAGATGSIDGTAGSSVTTTKHAYMYALKIQAVPAVTSLSVTHGPASGGTAVTITGTAFYGATGVTFGGTAATSVVVVSDTSITCVTPAHASGTDLQTQVTGPGGSSSDVEGDNFTFDFNTGTGAFEPQLPIIGGTATNTAPPSRAADATWKMQLPLLGGTATNALPPGVVTPGLVAEYVGKLAKSGLTPGNNTDPTGIFDDLKGSYDGTLNTFAYTTASGWSGNGGASDPYALTFDGSSDYVGCGDTSASEDKTFSFEAWVKTTHSAASAPGIISEIRDTSNPQSVASLCLWAGVPYFYTVDDAWASASESDNVTTVNDNLWHHLVGTCDGTYLRLYIDGAQKGTGAAISAGARTVAATEIGRVNAFGTLTYFPGSIATVRVYSRSLTAEEVLHNYALGPLGSTVAVGNGIQRIQSPLIGGTAANVPPARSATTTYRIQTPLFTATATNTPPAPRSATIAQRIQPPILAGTAANVPPPRTATTTFKAQLPLLAGTATNTPPPARTATVAQRIQLPLLTATATNTPPPARSATTAFRVQTPLFSATATNTPPPARSGAVALRVQSPLLAGTATNTSPAARAATAAFRVQTPLLAGTAVNVPPARTGNAVLLLGNLRLGGTATNVAPPARAANATLKAQGAILGGTATNTPIGVQTATGSLSIRRTRIGGAATNTPPPARSATVGQRIQSPILSGTATNSPPAPRSATGGIATQALILGGTAEVAASRSADGALELSGLAFSGAAHNGALDRTAAGAMLLPGVGFRVAAMPWYRYRGVGWGTGRSGWEEAEDLLDWQEQPDRWVDE